MKKTTLILKQKETDETIKLEWRSSLKFARKLLKLQKQGFELVDAEGDPRLSSYLKEQVTGYEKDPLNYKPSIDWSLAGHLTKQKVGDVKRSAKKIVEKLKK